MLTLEGRKPEMLKRRNSCSFLRNVQRRIPINRQIRLYRGGRLGVEAAVLSRNLGSSIRAREDTRLYMAGGTVAAATP